VVNERRLYIETIQQRGAKEAFSSAVLIFCFYGASEEHIKLDGRKRCALRGIFDRVER
jgi:hypothetical protein